MRNNNTEQSRSLFSSKGSYLRGYLTSTSLRGKQDEENIQITLLITAAAEWVDAAEIGKGGGSQGSWMILPTGTVHLPEYSDISTSPAASGHIRSKCGVR